MSGFAPDLLAGRRILVTGGGTGLGRAMAARCVELGATVVICGRRTEVLAATAAEIGAAETYRVDLRDPQDVAAMMGRVWDQGPLDALVNNAAANFIARTETLSHRAVDAVLNITLHGTLYATMEAGRRWIAEKRPGSVLSIAATYAWHGSPYVVPSAMAKAGVVAMTRSLAVEWGPHGIRLNAIAPGPFPTKGAWERLLPRRDLAAEFESRGPLGRPGRHEELANLAAYLLSDMAGYVTGDCITIDGGRWIKGAGNFSFLEKLTDAEWDGLRPARGKGT